MAFATSDDIFTGVATCLRDGKLISHNTVTNLHAIFAAPASVAMQLPLLPNVIP
jgi:hypothetical protein